MLDLLAFLTAIFFAIALSVGVAVRARQRDRSAIVWFVVNVLATVFVGIVAAMAVRRLGIGAPEPMHAISTSAVIASIIVPVVPTTILSTLRPSVARFRGESVSMCRMSTPTSKGTDCMVTLRQDALVIRDDTHEQHIPYQSIRAMRIPGEALIIRYSSCTDDEQIQELSLMPLGGPDNRVYRRTMAAYVAHRVAQRAKHLTAVQCTTTDSISSTGPGTPRGSIS